MTSKLVVNTIESDTGISSVSFASSISMSSTSKFFFSAAGIDIGADTNINRPEAGVLGFNINGGEKARIKANGNVGIGTDDPQEKLHITDSGNPKILIEDTDSSNQVGVRYKTPTQDWITGLHGGISSFKISRSSAFGTNDYFTIDGSGKVLIGTTSSSGSHKLEVNSGTDNEGIKVVSTDAGSYITFADNDTTGSTRIGAVDNDFKIDANSAERVRITSTGQFIVGTNPSVSSGNIVHIEAPTSFNSGETIVNIEGNNGNAGARILLQNNDTGAGAYNEILGTDAGGQSTSSIRFYNTDQSNNYGEIAFGTRDVNNAPPADRMRISKDGYVTQANRPAFDAGLSTGAVSATNPIVFNNAQVNRANCYNTSNGRFTAPVTGLYFFYYGGLKNNNSNVLRLKLRKGNGTYLNNGREFRLDENGGNYGENASMCIIVSLTANEYVQVYVTEGTVYGQYNAYTYFGGYLLA